MFELVPPKDLAAGIREGTLRAATPKRGDASVLIKNVKDGRIAGKADLRQVKPTALDVVGPAVWQAMALATQQHYLAEISARLDGIKAGVDEVLARLDDDRIGALSDIGELAAKAQAAARRDGQLSEGRTDDLRRAAADAKRLWHQIATTARRQLGQYREGKLPGADVEHTFAMLTHATRVLTQCSDALVAVPHLTAAELRAAVEEEQDRLHPALPEFFDLCGELLAASGEWRESHDEYEAGRPRNWVARQLRVPPVGIKRHKGRLDIDVRFRPELEPLAHEQEEQLRGLIGGGHPESPALVVEVQPEGTVLLGPAQPDAAQPDDGGPIA